MATQTGEQLAEGIRQTVEDLAKACAGLGEDAATRAPEGRWTPKEILSHVMGPVPGGYVKMLRRFLDEEVPLVDIVPEVTHFTPERAAKSAGQLMEDVRAELGQVADFAAGLTPEQLDRKGRVPFLKDTPLTQYPTLETMLFGLGQFHVRFHIDHMHEVLQSHPDS